MKKVLQGLASAGMERARNPKRVAICRRRRRRVGAVEAMAEEEERERVNGGEESTEIVRRSLGKG